MSTPCKDKGYEVGQVFEVISGDNGSKYGDILVLREDDGSSRPYWRCIKGSYDIDDWYCANINNVKRLWPKEELSKDVTVTCEGKETVISRESAEKLNLL